MYLCDATWLGFANPKEDNNASVESLCDTSLLKPRRTCGVDASLLWIFGGG
jgi:hypothetical protein